MPGLPHDVELPGAVHIGLGAETGPQAVASIDLRVQAGRDRRPFHNRPDRILMQSALVDVAVPVDAPEQRSRFETRYADPVPASADRAGFGRCSRRGGRLPCPWPPDPFWSARCGSGIPSLVCCTSSTRTAANSARRKAPAKPTSNRARSRIPITTRAGVPPPWRADRR